MRNIFFLPIFMIFISCASEQYSSNELEESNLDTSQILKEEKKSVEPLNKEIVLGSYKGKLGTSLDVCFRLDNENGTLSGFYFYEKIGIDIKLKGSIENNTLLAYELDYKGDTLAVIKGTIKESSISGKWINAKTKKEYPILIEKTPIEINQLPKEIEGKYYHKNCGLTLSIFKSKGEYYYNYTSKKETLKGKVRFSRGNGISINLENMEYAEDYFDVMTDDPERSKEYEKLKKIGKRTVGIECDYSLNEIALQNYGNSMNYYVKLNDCDEKYIHFNK